MFKENYKVYGVRKVWRQMQREGYVVARYTVARLMRELGIRGVIRGKSQQPLSVTRQMCAYEIWSIASLKHQHLTYNGYLILPMSPHGQALFMWHLLSMSMPAGSLAGG